MACTLPLRNTVMSNEPLKESQFFKTNFCELRMVTVRCMLEWKCLHVTQHHMQFLCTTNTWKTIKWVTINRIRSLSYCRHTPLFSSIIVLKIIAPTLQKTWVFKSHGPVCEALTFFLSSGWRKCWGTQQPNHTGTKLSACSLQSETPRLLVLPIQYPWPHLLCFIFLLLVKGIHKLFYSSCYRVVDSIYGQYGIKGRWWNTNVHQTPSPHIIILPNWPGGFRYGS